MLIAATPPPDPWTGPAVAALITAVIALVFAAGSIGWQVLAWVLGGARLKLRANSGAWIDQGLDGLPEQRWFIAFQVSNSGRASTIVSQYGFALPTKHVLVTQESYTGGRPIKVDPLPHTIEPGGTDTYFFNVEHLAERCIQLNVKPEDLTPYALTGHGETPGKWTEAGLDVLRRRIEHARPGIRPSNNG